MSDGAEDNLNPPAEKIENQTTELFKSEDDPLEDILEPNDSHKFNAADIRRKEDDQALISAHSRLLKLKADLQKAQQKVDEAQRTYDKARNIAHDHANQDADDLLLEPTPWNNYYKQLKAYYDREGHSNFKRTITDVDAEGLSEAEAKEIRTLSWWTCRQRKFKRRGELEQYKILLLNGLKFNWDPHAGPGPEKWLKNYSLLKEFKQKHGHVKVPVRYSENKLGSWLKTQVTQYRNAQEGKLPALSAERIRLLEEIGIDWGEKRVTTPWDARFQALVEYKGRFGNVNVPWQWKENVALAQWVNSQRKKYKDLLEGKRNNLSEEQINRLISIGFKWNTGGKGRYTDSQMNDQSTDSDVTTNDNVASIRSDANLPTVPPAASAGVVGAGQEPILPTGMAPNLPQGIPFPLIQGNTPMSGGATQDQSNNFLGSLGGNNSLNQPMPESMGPEATAYVQRITQQNQQDLSMLAYAYQQLNQQMNTQNNGVDQKGGNPFL